MATWVQVVDISSDSSERAEATCEECRMEEDLGMIIKGPKLAAEDRYDDFCVYPNRVALLPDQTCILENICEQKEPRVPLYVCTIRDAMVADEGRGKMYFNKDFTKAYLKKYLTKTGYDMGVYYNKAKKMKEVRIKMDMTKKHAVMTSNWMSVVDAENYGEGEVLMFWFRRNHEGGLKLLVNMIQPGAFGLGTHNHLALLEAHEL